MFLRTLLRKRSKKPFARSGSWKL